MIPPRNHCELAQCFRYSRMFENEEYVRAEFKDEATAESEWMWRRAAVYEIL